MSIGQSFKLAIKSLLLSKMRSLLTMLGIIIGVGAVIIIISIGDGLKSYLTDQFESMGANLVIANVTKVSDTRSVGAEEMYTLAEKNTDCISAVSPFVSVKAALTYGSDTYSTKISGVGESYDYISRLNLTDGRFLRYVDIARNQNVCAVGSYVAKEILSGKALGATIKIGGVPYRVIGVLEEKAGGTQNGDDDVVYVPYTNATRINGIANINTYYFSAVSDQTSDKAKWVVETELEKVFQDEDYYFVMNMAEVMDMMNSMHTMVMSVLIAIAAISLLVGGIGIMNIMLVSVSERTREIGIRKSLGAKRRDIRLQFIIEAGTTSAIGGIFGIILGVAASGVAGNALGITAIPSITAICVSVGVSVSIGVIFGFLPANKAAKLNPIDALRFE